MDGTGGAAATITGVAGGGLTGAGYTIASVSVVNAGTVAGRVVVSGGVMAATATDVKQFSLVVHTVTVSFSLHNHVFFYCITVHL